MYNRATILNLVDDAERATPSCACGAPMIAVDRDGGLWLECSTRPQRSDGLLPRLVSLQWLVGHRRRVIITPEEFRAA